LTAAQAARSGVREPVRLSGAGCCREAAERPPCRLVSRKLLRISSVVGLIGSIVLAGCNRGGEPGVEARSDERSGSVISTQPVPVTPPFDVRDEAEGLLLVWYDAQGIHTATKRSEIPEARRSQVRVDSLSAAPDQRLDPDQLYVADLRAAAADGRYTVRKATRTWFDEQVDHEKHAPPEQKAEDVVIYKAAWCGVCKSAAGFLKQKHVPFIEKDIEKDPAAAAEMQRKASAKGLRPTGVPVIDYHGELLLGFDQQRLSQLIGG
jgi:glutaredoxin